MNNEKKQLSVTLRLWEQHQRDTPGNVINEMRKMQNQFYKAQKLFHLP